MNLKQQMIQAIGQKTLCHDLLQFLSGDIANSRYGDRLPIMSRRRPTSGFSPSPLHRIQGYFTKNRVCETRAKQEVKIRRLKIGRKWVFFGKRALFQYATWCDGTRLISARRKRELRNLVQIGRPFLLTKPPRPRLVGFYYLMGAAQEVNPNY